MELVLGVFFLVVLGEVRLVVAVEYDERCCWVTGLHLEPAIVRHWPGVPYVVDGREVSGLAIRREIPFLPVSLLVRRMGIGPRVRRVEAATTRWVDMMGPGAAS